MMYDDDVAGWVLVLLLLALVLVVAAAVIVWTVDGALLGLAGILDDIAGFVEP